MLEFIENLGCRQDLSVSQTLSLAYEQRGKARLRVKLDSGEEAGLFLKPGQMLRGGDILRAVDGAMVKVVCKPEAVVTAKTTDWKNIATACYHVGNRHAPIQIGGCGEGMWLRFAPDPILEELVEHLNLAVTYETAPFVPENGAYHNHRHTAE
ncbi:MAG: urease accessory protein UreE [Candidatus Adiutrix sp.]|jgi:urease accessory protein|nr:urease accessory protein UreE [Candidatus Adiutrix sp.]